MRRQQQNVVEGQGGRAALRVAHPPFHVRVLETVSGFWIAFILVTGPASQVGSVHLGGRRLGRARRSTPRPPPPPPRWRGAWRARGAGPPAPPRLSFRARARSPQRTGHSAPATPATRAD